MCHPNAGGGAMARTVAELPKGNRITNFISHAVVAKTFPMKTVQSVLAATNKQSIWQRDLPARVVVHYVIAFALYMQSSYREVLRCLLEGAQWLVNPSVSIRVTSKSGISQACTCLSRINSTFGGPLKSTTIVQR
jgi:hypothetical protein